MPSLYLEPFRFIEGTGTREIEAINICCQDVDYELERIWIPRSKRGTRGRRWIPITRELAPVIDALDPAGRPGDEPLLYRVGADGRRRPLTENGLFKAFMRASDAAGTSRRVRPHDLRHRYISRLVMARVPLPMVQEIVGHSNLTSILRVYSHPIPGEPEDRLRLLREDIMRFMNEGRDQPR